MSILKELDRLKAYKSLFSNNQAEINNMRKQIENLLMFKNTWEKYYNLNGGNKEVFRKRVKNKYPHNNLHNFTNIYMDPNEFIL